MIRRIAALLVAAVVAFAGVSHAAPYRVQTFVLFDGGTCDSTTHCSPWIPVLNANHINIRTWTTYTAPATDSTFSDSIATMQYVFSDSVSFMAADSAGVRVTATPGRPRDANGFVVPSFPVCVDTFLITPTTAAQTSLDTVITEIGINHAPVLVAGGLRSKATGAGFLTRVYPTPPVSVAAYGDGDIAKKYMRVNITPARRFTANTPVDVNTTSCSTTPLCGARVNGLKGFRMIATVYYNDIR